MTNTNAVADFPGVVEGVLVDDRGCIKCEYNLCGLTADGSCPECGEPVVSTYREPLLKYSDPGYIKTLRLGLRLILLSIIAAIVGSLIVGIITGVVVASTGEEEPSLALLAATTALGVITLVLSCLGWWLYSVPEPAHGRHDDGSARTIIRGAVVCYGAFGFGSMGLAYAMPDALLVSAGVDIVFSTAFAVLGLAGMIYTKRLALRLPDKVTVRRARTVFGLAIAAIASYAVMAVGLGLATVDETIGMLVMGIGAVFGGLCLLVGGVVFIFLICRLQRRLAAVVAGHNDVAQSVV